MIKDWYFCCCVKSSPDNTKAFLSTLDILENDKDDNQLLALAYQQIQRAEVWMQIYALPRVLTTLQDKKVPENVHVVLKPYFDCLVDLIPMEAAHSFRKLIKSLFQSGGSQRLLNSIEPCLEAISDLSPGKEPTVVPYLDLNLFLPETMLLAVIRNELLLDKSLASTLGIDTEKTGGKATLQNLVDQALNNNLGRMAFCLAAQISLMAGQPKERVLTRILSHDQKTDVTILEPDLLHLYAEAKYLDMSNDMEDDAKEITVQKLINESRTFQEFNGNFFVPEVTEEATPLPLRTIGVEAIRKGLCETFGLIYWQAVLWDIATQTDVEIAAPKIARYWRPPVNDEAETVQFESKFGGKADKKWAKRLNTLLNISSLEKPPIPAIRRGDSLRFPGIEGCSLYSPWVYHMPKKQSGKEYPLADIKKPEVLIRLAAGILISVRMLRHMAENSPYRSNFAALLAHAFQAFYTIFGHWLREFRGGEIRPNAATLPYALTGMALYCQSYVKEAGCGRIKNISPDDFVQLLHRPPDLDATSKRNNAEQIFVRQVLPEVLTQWVMDAYGGAPEMSGPMQWVECLPDIYKATLGSGIKMVPQKNAACAMRFLRPGDSSLDVNRFDWRAARGKNGLLRWEHLDARQILLTDRDLLPESWLKEEWEETVENRKPGSELARALERFYSLKNSLIEPEAKKYERWHTEWKDLLKTVDQTKKMDRFIRLRLLEILDAPVLRGDTEGQELIALVLMEYGSAYDLNQLFKKVFAPQIVVSDGMSGSERIDLQKMLLPVMQNKIKILSSSTDMIFQDPREAFREKLIINLIEKSFSFVAGNYLEKGDPNNVGQVLLSSSIPNSTLHRKTVMNIEWLSSIKRLVPEKKSFRVKDWMVNGAAVDPNRQTANIFYNDINTDGLVNLFETKRGGGRDVQSN